ncbi:hypothetical protein CNR22_04330 [Sphingobacteriaceae bacterium]|nr:hypothetical protein CNR22_04330 [Sphingobacteriaceae bacterium]
MSKLQLFITGLSGWFHIFLFPVLISFMLSLLVYLTMPAAIGVALSLLLIFIGMIIGAIMATRILRRRGAASFREQEIKPSETENN